jgi:hypothetical protein
MGFWRQFEEGSPAATSALPPLTDEVVRSFESRYGVRLPARLVELLNEQNGGSLVDTGFKFDGEDYYVDTISGLAGADRFGIIRPVSEIFDREDEVDLLAQIKEQLGKPELVFPFGDYGGHCMYALDYNQSSKTGDPRVIYFVIEGDLSGVTTLADTFEDFLKGHYLGEPTPSVTLGDVAGETLLEETRSSGRHVHGGTALEFFNWVCDRKKELVIYTKSVWDMKVSLRRSVIPKKSLEPDFCEISKVEYVAEPATYQLLLHVDPNRPRASVDDAEQSGTVWKNTKSDLLYDSVHSYDREQLVRLRKQISPNYRGKPTSLTKQLNGFLKELGIIDD